MHVRYRVTLDDFVALNLYLNRKSGAGRPGYLILWLVAPALGIAGAVRLLQLEHLPAAVTVAALSLFWLVIFPSRYREGIALNTRRFVKKLGGRGIIGERGLILTEEMLVAVSETFRTEVRWENMTGVDVVGDYTYIFITGISALIIPRRGFDSDAEYEAVRDFALRKLAAGGTAMNGDPVVLAVVAVMVAVFAVFLLLLFVNIRLWVQALLTNTPVSIFDIVGMRLRRCPPQLVVHAMIVLHQRGTKVPVREVELCYFAARKTGTSVTTATELAALVETARRTEPPQT